MGKYEMLRDAVLELTNVGEDKDLHNFIKNLSTDIDRMGGDEKNQNLLTAAEWNALGYSQRVELYNTNKEAYDAALQGNFKGETK